MASQNLSLIHILRHCIAHTLAEAIALRLGLIHDFCAFRKRHLKLRFHMSDPVSYTHLDVYKRQGLIPGDCVCIASPRINCRALEKGCASPFSTATGSVSYTHLDVYKRQPQYGAIASRHTVKNTRFPIMHCIVKNGRLPGGSVSAGFPSVEK